ncbi:MAG: ribonuclease HI [Burkholderiales bacterium]|uniref:ribonuclease HI n=1 Tax=Nitrosomonas sp. TaxID=42353 RepID=UPI001DAD8519|nr:ribonuclease HI [Nitrosomonas sp.]MCB1949002.1 ribonuclease HI [Nitrosomonas sp.]MCP5243342.1 ribonuclease HI [Burkholderiales bacterium]
MTKEDKIVDIYTDGACKGNPGVGGWGAVLKYGVHEQEIFGGEKHTTNNRMELLAAIRALESLKRACRVRLYTDSQYVHNGIGQWMQAWKARNWRTANKKPVKNEDLWRTLDRLSQKHDIEWLWVRGHAGHEGNERADMLANRGVKKILIEAESTS